MYWISYLHITSLVLLYICFYYSNVNILDGALSEFSLNEDIKIVWTAFLWLQSISMFTITMCKIRSLSGYACGIISSLSLLYISFFGLGEGQHNAVAVLFFVSCLSLVFLSSPKIAKGMLLTSLLVLALDNGYALFETVFCLMTMAFSLQEHYKNTHTAYH